MQVEVNMNVDELIKCALAEDIGSGDITTDAILPRDEACSAVIICRDEGIISGIDVARKVFCALDGKVAFKPLVKDGDEVSRNQEIARLDGSAKAILKGERVALNFLQKMSGIATYTSLFVKKCGKVTLIDTRKTDPCMRELEKYAVTSGGGKNHRFGLYDMVLVKDNHIKVAGSVAEALRRAKHAGGAKVEVEAESLEEVNEAMSLGCDIIMLDNMSVDDIRKSVELIGGRAKIEVSGGITLGNVREVARSGVDFISVGVITHSSGWLDMSLKIL